MRADRFLALHCLAPTRSKAEDWIKKDLVEIFLHGQWKKIKKTSFEIDETFRPEDIRVLSDDLTELVSRAGAKLARFLDFASEQGLNLSFENKVCLDVGQSTGGFTEVLLKRGAQRVIGVEVGHSQLHTRLREDSRVVAFEHLHIANARASEDFRSQVPTNGFDWIVVDVSFISLTKVLPALSTWGEKIIFLIKPQFETEKKLLAIDEAITKVKNCFEKCGGVIVFEQASSLGGRDGNQEYFVAGRFADSGRSADRLSDKNEA